MSVLIRDSRTGIVTSTDLTESYLDLFLRQNPNYSLVGIATTANANYYILLNETTEEFRQPYVSNKLTYNPYSGALNLSGSLSGITTLSMNGAITGITSISISGRLYDGNGSCGSSSQILSSTGSAIQWINANTTNVGSATSIGINLDSTNAPKYLTFVDTSSGNNLVKVDTDLTYNPSTNVLTATSFSGGGSNLTSLTAGNLSGTIPSGVLGNSTHYIGTTAIALNRASASQSLTGINIDGSSGSCTGNAATATTHVVTDSRNTTTTPQTINMGVVFDFKANTTEGLSDGGTYFGEMTFRQYGSSTDWSGGLSHQLGFTDNGNIWQRSGSSTTWGSWKKILDSSNYVTYSAFTGQITSTQANSTATGGGQIYLNGANGNRIDFAGGGYATPATTTRSVGTKIVLDPQITASNVDYAIGVENTAIWSSVPSSASQFKWYAGTTNVATLSGTGTFTINGSDQNIVASESGTSSTWRGRILSKNSSADKASFLGVYASAPGVFAHNHALNAWATLYVNTTSGSDGGDVILAGSGSVAIGAASASYKLDVTGSIRATSQLLSNGNLTAWNTTTPATGVGGLHLGAASGTSNVGPAITFGARDASSGTNAQAGIYINSDGTYGTRMYFATTDSYATGSKTAMSISEAGVVNFTRATPTSGGNTIWHQGNDGSGSGLDADLLDGNDSAYFLNTSSTAQTKTAALTLNQILIPNTVGSAADSQPTALSYGRLQGYGDFYINANTDASGTEYLILTAGYSVANGTAANGMAIGQSTLTWKNNTIWHGGNDGAGSGLDADLLDGYSSATTATGNTIVLRDANGDDYRRYGFGSYFNSTDDVSAGTLTYLMGKFGDNYYRSATAAKVATFISGQTMNINGTSSSAPLLSALGTYVWSASTLPTGYNMGIQCSFVQASNGWQNYGSVMNMMTYSGGGGSLQLFVPYSPTYGGTGLQVRFGNYDVSSGNSWTSWKTLLASDNYTGYSAFTGIVSSGTGTSGGFQNVTYAAGRNRIWSFGNADAYGLSYFQGGPDYIGLHFGTATQAASQFWVSDSGISQTSASSRAPLFYDSNDTTYYLDPNSTADSALRIRGGALHGPNPTWGTYLLVGGDGRQNYTNNTTTASVCSTNGNLHIDAASGYATYLNFYDGDIVYFGSGASANVGSINSSGHASFPIYYDYNNTGYYTDPASTSNLNNVQVVTFGVGTAASGTTGEIRATNNVTAYYSDERLKENITTISSALSKLLTLRGVTFNSNEIAEQYGYTDKKEQVGVIAQDVEKVLPQVVVPAPFDIAQDEDGNEYSKSGENYKTVHYDKLVPLLIEAIKELKGEIEELKSKIST